MKINVIYVEEEESLDIPLGWYIVWFLAACLFILFLLEPTWFILPPFIHLPNVR